MFACRMTWDDDLLRERMALVRIQYQIAIYAFHLSTGSTLFVVQLKRRQSKRNATRWSCSSFIFNGVHDRKDHASDRNMRRLGYILAPVYAELDRYEQVPNRREPSTPEML